MKHSAEGQRDKISIDLILASGGNQLKEMKKLIKMGADVSYQWITSYEGRQISHFSLLAASVRIIPWRLPSILPISSLLITSSLLPYFYDIHAGGRLSTSCLSLA